MYHIRIKILQSELLNFHMLEEHSTGVTRLLMRYDRGKKQQSAQQLAFDKTGEDVCCTQAEIILIYHVHSFVSAPNPAENALE